MAIEFRRDSEVYHNDGLCIFRSLYKTIKKVIPEKESAGKRMTYPARVPITGRLNVHIREKEER